MTTDNVYCDSAHLWNTMQPSVTECSDFIVNVTVNNVLMCCMGRGHTQAAAVGDSHTMFPQSGVYHCRQSVPIPKYTIAHMSFHIVYRFIAVW